jgi:hypothetical protein
MLLIPLTLTPLTTVVELETVIAGDFVQGEQVSGNAIID